MGSFLFLLFTSIVEASERPDLCSQVSYSPQKVIQPWTHHYQSLAQGGGKHASEAQADLKLAADFANARETDRKSYCGQKQNLSAQLSPSIGSQAQRGQCELMLEEAREASAAIHAFQTLNRMTVFLFENLVAKFQAFREKFQGPELTRKLRSEGISTRELEQEYFYLLFEQASLKETPAESLHVQIMQDYRTENHRLIEKCKKQEATLVEVASRAKKIGCQVTPKLLETKCPEI